MDDLVKMAEKRKDLLLRILGELEERLPTEPEGSLRITHVRGQTAYYYRQKKTDRTGQYIHKRSKKDLIASLAQKDYDNRVYKAIQKELQALERFLTLLPKSRYEQVAETISSERRLLIKPVIDTDEIFAAKWKSTKYKGKDFPEDFPEYITDNGERVRSKSEILIANTLKKEGILYRYEYPLKLKGIGTVYPDFTVLNLRLRKEYYIEHFGLLDDPVYLEKTLIKIKGYQMNGIFPGEKILFTAETGNNPLDMRYLQKMIDHFLK